MKTDRAWKIVKKKEFYEYINTYPRKLERDVYGVFDPPLVTYNDFSLGVWDDSVVAWHKADCDDHEYRVLERAA